LSFANGDLHIQWRASCRRWGFLSHMTLHLVTGATGHIGNVLVRQLLERGDAVRALVRPGKIPQALQGIKVEIIPGDILDRNSILRAVDGVDIVYHLAAKIGLASGSDPELERVNLEGTRNMLSVVRKADVRRLVYVSSIYALRVPETGVVDESLPFDPAHAHGAYDRSKATASLEVQKATASGLDAVIVCPTAVVGPYDFQFSEAGRGIIYNLPAGIKFYLDGAYDFVDVRDVAKGLILAAQKGTNRSTYILGGDRLTVREISECIWEAASGWHAGVRLPDWVADLAANILPRLLVHPLVTPYSLAAVRSNSHISHEKACCELGYCPRPARQAILDGVRWWQKWLDDPAPVPETIAKAAA
jgi:dihydroflavonol-4-reductase